MPTTLHSLMQEMQSFTEVDETLIKTAKGIKKLAVADKSRFDDLLDSWINGDYDESPELLVQELEGIARRY